MFWKYNSPSSVQIDALLQQENVSLQDLMDEEELLQECISQNKKVIDYLTQPETLEALVSFLVTDPSPDRELRVRFKYANLASELLTSDVPAIVDKVASSTNLLQMLYKFLEKEKPLNPLLASFVSKVFGMLVQRRSEQVLDFLKSQGDFVEVAIRHIGTSAVMDLLCKLICGVDDDDQEIKQGIHQWLNECHLIEQLIEKLAPDCDSEEHSSVDQLLCELVTKGQDNPANGSDSQSNGSQSRLLATLESKEIINKLMDTLLHEERNESSVSHVINILLTLLSSKGSHRQLNFHHTNSLDIIDAELDSRSSVLRTIVARLPDLQKILKQPTKLGKLVTAYGMEVERLGSTRLKVVSLISSLIATQDIYVHTEMAELRTLHLLFELFFKFSLNNFLHTQVTQCITCILSKSSTNNITEGIAKEIDGLNNNPRKLENGDEELNEDEKDIRGVEEKRESKEREEATFHPLLIQLFNDCNIIQKILECYTSEEEAAAEKRLHNMVGYMGHIREMANNIVQYSKEGSYSQLIQEQIKKLPNDVITQWEEFTLIGLAEVNLKNKVIPLQMPGVIHRDSEEDSEEEFYSVESVVITNKGFKERDMDTLGDMCFVDDFKEADDTFNGSQRLSTSQVSGGVSCCQEINIDDGTESSFEKFQEVCSEKKIDISMFDEMWKDKEKNITFQQNTKADEDGHHSSSEEEGDFDDQFDSIRKTEEKMDVEFNTGGVIQWSEVFDQRGNALNVESGFNPWQSAPASETSESNSWADFGAGLFKTSSDPFAQSNSTQNSGSFAAFSSQNPNNTNATSQSPEFRADFSNVFFRGTPPAAASFQADSGSMPLSSEAKNATSDAQSDSVPAGSECLQDVCDANKMIATAQPDVVFSEEMESIETTTQEFTQVTNSPPDVVTISTNLGEEKVPDESCVKSELLNCEDDKVITSENTEKTSLETSEASTEMELVPNTSERELVPNTSETHSADHVQLSPVVESMEESSIVGKEELVSAAPFLKDDDMEN